MLKREMVNYQDLAWVNDFKLLLCSWIYDLNYGVSRGVVRERGYLEEMLGYLPQILNLSGWDSNYGRIWRPGSEAQNWQGYCCSAQELSPAKSPAAALTPTLRAASSGSKSGEWRVWWSASGPRVPRKK